MKKELVLALVVVLAIASILYLASNNTLTSYVVNDNSNVKSDAPRHVFYNSPRIDSKPGFIKTCYPSHEIMPVIPDARCCEGLQELTIYDESQKDCSAPLSGGSICSDCGNGLCEYAETECNCPQDCNKPEVRL